LKNHSFTKEIKIILQEDFDELSNTIFNNNTLLQYLNIKTSSADKGSKSRGSFGNIYSIYVLVEDYVNNNFFERDDYTDYSGAVFTDLFTRQRELPFGSKLQNHALNHRCNQEFKKYFPLNNSPLIIRNTETNRYWINEKYLKIEIDGKIIDISKSIIKIIDKYIEVKQSSFNSFIQTLNELQEIVDKDEHKIIQFIENLLLPTVDARIFEIVSFSILKYYYFGKIIYIGFEIDEIEKENLRLFKTGRTNANDGGIDFVMKPLGRFFQVTETTDVKKYFLDIDKIHHYPITFVVKSNTEIDVLKQSIELHAKEIYPVKEIVKKFMSCIEEIINNKILKERLDVSINNGYLKNILNEILVQSKVEFNYEEMND